MCLFYLKLASSAHGENSKILVTLMLLMANIWPIQNDAENLQKVTLAHGYSSESTRRELSNEYQQDRV